MEAQHNIYIMHRNTNNINYGLHSIVDVIILDRPDLPRAVYYYCCNKEEFLRAIALYWKRYNLDMPHSVYLDPFLKDLCNITCSDIIECIEHRDSYKTDNRFESLYEERSKQYHSSAVQNIQKKYDLFNHYNYQSLKHVQSRKRPYEPYKHYNPYEYWDSYEY